MNSFVPIENEQSNDLVINDYYYGENYKNS